MGKSAIDVNWRVVFDIIFFCGVILMTFIWWDMTAVWYRALEAGGELTVSDTVQMLQFEIYVITPLVFMWLVFLCLMWLEWRRGK